MSGGLGLRGSKVDAEFAKVSTQRGFDISRAPGWNAGLSPLRNSRLTDAETGSDRCHRASRRKQCGAQFHGDQIKPLNFVRQALKRDQRPRWWNSPRRLGEAA